MGPTYKYIKDKGDDFRERKAYILWVFLLNKTKIDLIDNLKYLGITLFKNGNWYRSQKCIAQHASRALHNLFTVFNKIELPTSQKC